MRFSTFSLLRRGVWRRSAFLWLGVSTLTVAAALAQESREWRDSAGRPIATSTNEKLVGTLRLDGVDDPGKVRIKMGGKTFRFTLANLSEADREYVEAERAKKNAPQTASNPTADASTTESNSTAAQPTRTNVPNPAPALAEDASRALVAIPKDGVKRALLVGVDDYAEFADLKYAVADVEAIRERLIGLGFKPENIVELKSTNPANLRPSQRYIRRQVDALLKAAGPNDLLFLHFSGHGFQTDGVVRFAPDDAVATGDENVLDPETTISLTEIIERLKTSEAKFKWLIVDACRENPTGTRSAAANARALKNIDPNKGVLVLQSCAEGELSFEDADAGRGLFTGRLLEAFDGKADFDGDGQMSALDVCKYVSEQTLAASQTRFNATQTPYFSGEFADFIVAEDLKVDGLGRAEWARADALYDEAKKLVETDEYEDAKEKIDAALVVVANVPDDNADKADYRTLQKMISDAVARLPKWRREFGKPTKIVETVDELEDAVANARDGEVIQLAAGTYRLRQRLEAPSGRTIILAGGGERMEDVVIKKTVKDETDDKDYFQTAVYIPRGSEIKLTMLTVEAREVWAAVYCDEGGKATATNCCFGTKEDGTAIRIDGGRAVLKDCFWQSHESQTAVVTYDGSIEMENCDVYGNVALYDATKPSTIKNCKIHDTDNSSGITISGPDGGNNSPLFEIIDCEIYNIGGNSRSGIGFFDGIQAIIRDCEIYKCGDNGVNIHSNSRVTLDNVTIRDGSDSSLYLTGLSVYDNSQAIVRGGEIRGFRNDSISFPARGVSISKNSRVILDKVDISACTVGVDVSDSRCEATNVTFTSVDKKWDIYQGSATLNGRQVEDE